MKKLNNNKKDGITLISLVVTTVVLLILAGVSINAVVGDDGVIKSAQESAKLTEESEAKEIMNKVVLEYYLARNGETLEEFLKTKVPNRIDNVTRNEDGTLTISKNGYTITVDNKPGTSDGNNTGGNSGENTNGSETQTPESEINGIKVVENSNGSGTALGKESTYLGNTLYITFNHSIKGGITTVEPGVPYAVTKNGTYHFFVIGTVNEKEYIKRVSVTVDQFKDGVNLNDVQIGDYVNYTYDTSASYSLSSSYSGASNQTIEQTTGLTWQVLNIDKENNKIDIISTNPTSKKIAFYGTLGYNNGPYIMNSICEAQYSNKKLNVKARNISLLDMEKHLTTIGISARNKSSSGALKYGVTRTSDYYNWYPALYEGQIGAGINVSTITQPDITKGNDPYNESIEDTEPMTDKTNKKTSVLTVTQTSYYISINNDNYGAAANVLNNSTSYWISARCVGSDSYVSHFGLRFAGTSNGDNHLYGTNGNSTADNSYTLRPLVSLSSALFTGGKDSNGAWNLVTVSH